MKAYKDYSFIKGVNYEYENKNEDDWRRELEMGKRIGLNSVRIWLKYYLYTQNPKEYIAMLKNFFRVCGESGYSVIVILFNANDIHAEDPFYLEEPFKKEGEGYLKCVVNAIRKEPALLMYDMMNEPGGNHLIWDANDDGEREYWFKKHWNFVRYFSALVKTIDPITPTTVGCSNSMQINETAECVDVLSYHCYAKTRAQIIHYAEIALEASKDYAKPVLCTETGCVARGNPYDVVIEVLSGYKIPWYVYGLTADGYWADSQGIFYRDGTVRDPAIVAAIMGFYRNRDYNTIVPENPNREHFVSECLNRLSRLFDDNAVDVFNYHNLSADALLEVCEELANYLEGAQLVSMRVPPTARINQWRNQKNPNLLEIKDFAYEMAEIVRRACHIR